MKKLLGISLIAVLAVSPFAANASVVIPTVNADANSNIASTSYVASAYNDAAGKINDAFGERTADNKFVLRDDDPATDGADETVEVANIATGLKDTYGLAAEANATATEANTTALEAASVAQTANTAITTLNGESDQTGSVANTVKTQANDATFRAGEGDHYYTDITPTSTIADAINDVDARVESLRSSVTSALTTDSITDGTSNGTINVNGTPVSVYGLGSAAYTDSDDYDEAGAADAVKEIIGGGEETTGKITLEGVNGGKTVQEAVTILQGGVNAAATIDKLNDGEDGYDIDANTLKVQGEDVLTINRMSDIVRDDDPSNNVIASEKAVHDAIVRNVDSAINDANVAVTVYTTWGNPDATLPATATITAASRTDD